LTSNIDTTRTLTIPGTAKNAITVGAWDTKKTWTDLNNNNLQNPSVVVGAAGGFSSNGPTRDGRIKPEIAAPGRMIASTLSADAPPSGQYSIWKGTAIYPNAYILRDNRHAIGLGTSFAAPIVAGGIALMLEKNPGLDAVQIRSALTGTAKQDGFTGATPNNKWGYGKVDFVAAMTPTSVGNSEAAGELPQAFALLQNYPNPFNPATMIAFQLPAASRVEIAIFDVMGRNLRRLFTGELPAGAHRLPWDGRDEAGRPADAGVYFCKMKAGNFAASRKLLLLQ
jgi:subtilisin family serine protease